jgi:quercetin dioxygenase-like cupin family protein
MPRRTRCARRPTPASASRQGTTRDYDQVIVALGDAELSLTVDGKTTNTWKRGDVVFIGRNVKHQSQNAGSPPTS